MTNNTDTNNFNPPNLCFVVAITLYVSSFVLDLFDGMAARKFHQTSEYGGLLDMITDRCSTAGLLHVLSFEYATATATTSRIPMARSLFLMLMILDLSSHWCQMFASAKLDMHHKSDDANKNHFFLVRWYYGYYYFFGYCCVGAEFSYVLLYILSNVSNAVGGDSNSMIVHTEWVQLALYLVLPGCAIKQLVNVVQLCSACHSVAANDAEHKTK
jgi:CDP-diacylglycerol--inositol 3-phosphatidyltransferase